MSARDCVVRDRGWDREGDGAESESGGGSKGVVGGAWEDGGSELGGAAGDRGGSGGITYRASSSRIVSRPSRSLTPLAIPMPSALAPGQVGRARSGIASSAPSDVPMRANTSVRTSVFFGGSTAAEAELVRWPLSLPFPTVRPVLLSFLSGADTRGARRAEQRAVMARKSGKRTHSRRWSRTLSTYACASAVAGVVVRGRGRGRFDLVMSWAIRTRVCKAVRRTYIRSGDTNAMRVLSICSGLSCKGVPIASWICASGLGFGGENKKRCTVSRARRIASERRDAHERRSTSGAARAPLREAYAATRDGDEGYWHNRKRDQSICARSGYMRARPCHSKLTRTTLDPVPLGIVLVLCGVLFALLLGRWSI